MSAFMTNVSNGIIVYLPNGVPSKIAGYGDTIEATRLSANSIPAAINVDPNPGAGGVNGSGVIASVNGTTASKPITTGFVQGSPGDTPAVGLPNSGASWQSGQNTWSGVTTFPGISSASIIAATPGLQQQINSGSVIVVVA
jgi:hypothetical protein